MKRFSFRFSLSALFGRLALIILLTALPFCTHAQKGPKPQTKSSAPTETVRWVFCGDTPELKRLGERARELANANYPKIVALLSKDPSKPPQHFDIVIKKRLKS